MAAAIGAGLPVQEPTGNMIVDIGGGTSEVAVISLGGIVASQSVRVAGDELDDAVIQFIKKEYSLALGERTAEEIKMALGSAWPLQEELTAEIRGRDLVSGLPKTVAITTEEIRGAIEEPVTAIVDAVKATLDKTPPELAADIMEQGIMLTGGGALLIGLDAAPGPRDRHAHPHRRQPAAVRRRRLGSGARGVRRAAGCALPWPGSLICPTGGGASGGGPASWGPAPGKSGDPRLAPGPTRRHRRPRGDVARCSSPSTCGAAACLDGARRVAGDVISPVRGVDRARSSLRSAARGTASSTTTR